MDDGMMTLEEYQEKYARKARAKRSQRKGKVGEDIATAALQAKGVRMVDKIATPVRIVATKKASGQTWHRVVWEERVRGDRSGILPGGRRVLAEVKTRDEKLSLSDFEDHQIAALHVNGRYGGLSLVVWVSLSGTFVMEWPIPGLKKFHPLSVEQARELEWEGV